MMASAVRSNAACATINIQIVLAFAMIVPNISSAIIACSAPASSAYGSGHFKLDGTPGQETLALRAHLSADGRSVLIVVPDMKPVMQMQLDYDLRSRQGAALRDTLYLTVHAVDPMDLARVGFGSLDWRASLARVSSTPSVAAPVAMASVALGWSLYQQKGCVGCHSIEGTTAGKTGPTLKGLYGSDVKLTTGAVLRANDAYLRRAILDPAKEIVNGFEPGMPPLEECSAMPS